jgi:hypothetical protein
MIESPADYHWSSYREHIGLDGATLVNDSSTFLALEKSEQQRRQSYKTFASQGIENRTGQRIESRGQGKPTTNKLI